MKNIKEIHLNEHALTMDHIRAQEAVVVGYRLESGDVLETTDVYDSSGGRWESCPCPGLTLQEGSAAKWVRPAPFTQAI